MQSTFNCVIVADLKLKSLQLIVNIMYSYVDVV